MCYGLPHFLIIGAQKAGTTAAARNLALHPRLSIFRGVTEYGQKEIEFFNQHWDRGVEWYLGHFSRADATSRQVGEKTAELLHRTVCHERMWRVNRDMKLIVLLRNPVERAFSQWRMAALHKGDEPRCFAAVIAEEAARLADQDYRSSFYECRSAGISTWREGYVLKGMYAEQLESLLRWFPRERVHVAVSERVRKDMPSGYASICRFLGVSTMTEPFAEHFVGKVSSPMEPDVRRLLAEIYAEPNQRLFELLQEAIPEWE